MSSQSSSDLQTSNIRVMSRMEIDNKMRSSAYIKEFTQIFLILQPQFKFSRLHRISSMKRAKSNGLKTPPCLVPESKAKGSDEAAPQRTLEKLLENQSSKIFINVRGTPLFIILIKSASLFILSKAASISREHTVTVDLFFVKYSIVFRTEYTAEGHPVPALNPNCRSEVLRKGRNLAKRQRSKIFETTGVNDMPL